MVETTLAETIYGRINNYFPFSFRFTNENLHKNEYLSDEYSAKIYSDSRKIIPDKNCTLKFKENPKICLKINEVSLLCSLAVSE